MLRAALDACSIPLLVIDRDFSVTFANDAARQEVDGRDPVAFGLRCHEVSHGSDTPCSGPHHACPLSEVLDTGQSATRVHNSTDPQGRQIVLEFRADAVRDSEGRVTSVAERWRDISDEVRIARERNAHLHHLLSLERVDSIVAGAADLAAMLDPLVEEVHTRFGCDRAWLAHPTERDAAALHVAAVRERPGLEPTLRAGVDVPLDEAGAAALKDALEAGRPTEQSGAAAAALLRGAAVDALSQIVVTIRPRVGAPWLLGLHQCERERTWTAQEHRLLEDVAQRIANALGSLLFLRRLENARADWEQAFDAVQDHICVLDADGVVRLANAAVRRAFEATHGDVIGLDHTLLYFADDVEPPSHRALQSSEAVVTEMQMPSLGGWCQVAVYPRRDEHGERSGAVLVVHDVTERRHAVSEVRRYAQRLALLVQHSPLAVIEWNLDFEVVEWNRAAERIFGHTREDAMGKHASFIVPEDMRQHVDQVWEGLLTLSGGTRSTNENVVADGRVIVCEWYNASIVDDEGRVSGVASLVDDITDRRRAEAEREHLEAQVRHAQKLESLGVLAGGIAHDFNNLLTGVLGNASLALAETRDNPRVRDRLQRIEEAADRAAGLSREMLAYSGKGRFVVEPLDLSELVEEMARMLEVSVAKNAAVHLRLSHALPAIHADATQIRQVILNLITNASDAIGEDAGEILVTTGTRHCNREYLRGTYVDEALAEGTYVFLEVVDDGCGMDEDTLARVFDPFFTTKFTGRGLGLATVLGIVRGHSGAIRIESMPARGTVVTALFPATDDPVSMDEPDSQAGVRAPCSGTVLVVDDEETVLQFAADALVSQGFDVLTARDGREAVEVYEHRGAEIAVVLLDLTMPQLGGQAALAELRAIDADVRVVLSSGYDEEDVAQRLEGEQPTGFLQKPYRAQELVDRIRHAIARRRRT